MAMKRLDDYVVTRVGDNADNYDGRRPSSDAIFIHRRCGIIQAVPANWGKKSLA